MYFVGLVATLAAIACLAEANTKPLPKPGSRLISSIGNHIIESLAKGKAAAAAGSNDMKKNNLRKTNLKTEETKAISTGYVTITAYQGNHCGVPLEQFTLQMGKCVLMQYGYFQFEYLMTKHDTIELAAVGYSDDACSNQIGGVLFRNSYPTKCGGDSYYYFDGIVLDGETYFKASVSNKLSDVPTKPGIQQTLFADQTSCESGDSNLFLRDWIHKSRCIDTGIDGVYEKFLCNDVSRESRVRMYYFDDSECKMESNFYYTREVQTTCQGTILQAPSSSGSNSFMFEASETLACVNLPNSEP